MLICSHEFWYDCSDWGHIAKSRTCTLSCLGIQMEVSQIRTKKIRFHLVFTVHTVMEKTDMSHIWAKQTKTKHQIWGNFTWILNIANVPFDTIMQEKKIHLNIHIAIMTNDEKKNPKYCFRATKKHLCLIHFFSSVTVGRCGKKLVLDPDCSSWPSL